MKIPTLSILMAALISILALSACSKDSIQRSAYLTMKNYDEMKCKKDNNHDCPTQIEYEKYQEEMEKLYTPSGY